MPININYTHREIVPDNTQKCSLERLKAASNRGEGKKKKRGKARVLMKNYFDNFKRASIFFYGKIHNETAAVISTYIDTSL